MEESIITNWNQIADRLEQLIANLHPESRGVWEWGTTASQSDKQHLDDFAITLEKTREHFELDGDTKIHGVFVVGSDLKLAVVGNSPTAAARAEYLSAVSPGNIAEIIAYIREKESVK